MVRCSSTVNLRVVMTQRALIAYGGFDWLIVVVAPGFYSPGH